MSALKTITPENAAELIRKGAVLVDIREADEHAREKITGAHHYPVSRIAHGAIAVEGNQVIFHCRSGARTQANASRLAASAPGCDVYLLEGGLEAWRKAGLPVTLDSRLPIEINRQVQIAAGSLVLLGIALGAFIAPAFYAIAAFVGGGLVFAGISGFCGMAKLFAVMPWNRQQTESLRAS